MDTLDDGPPLLRRTEQFAFPPVGGQTLDQLVVSKLLEDYTDTGDGDGVLLGQVRGSRDTPGQVRQEFTNVPNKSRCGIMSHKNVP